MLSASLRRRAVVAMLAVAGLTIVTGCALTSPAIITEPYVQADGTNADLPLEDGSVISLRNFVVVLDKAGGTGQVIGAVSYNGTQPVGLRIEAGNDAQVHSVDPTEEQAANNNSTAPVAPSVTIELQTSGLVQIGPEGVPFVLPVVNVAPGQHLDLTALSPVAGTVTWQVPIVAPTHYYEGLTATTTSPASAESGKPATTP